MTLFGPKRGSESRAEEFFNGFDRFRYIAASHHLSRGRFSILRTHIPILSFRFYPNAGSLLAGNHP